MNSEYKENNIIFGLGYFEGQTAGTVSVCILVQFSSAVVHTIMHIIYKL